MIKAVLLDLDGTLLPIETDKFLKKYMHRLSEKVSHIINQEKFIRHLLIATERVIKNNDPTKTNKEVFWHSFTMEVGQRDIEKMMPAIEEFYAHDFKHLGEGIRPDPLCQKIIAKLKKDNYTLVLATNPVFPRKAIHDRIRWASLNPDDFHLITAYENMCFCKPNLNYYYEISEKINIHPKRCLVVGNDIEEDMIAAQIGMKTFFVNSYPINRNNAEVSYDSSGGLNDLLQFLENQ